MRRLSERIRRTRSLRQKLAFSIAVTALLTALIEGVLDMFFDAQVARSQQENTDLLSNVSPGLKARLRLPLSM